MFTYGVQKITKSMIQFVKGYVIVTTNVLYFVLIFLSRVKAQTAVKFAVDKTEVVVGEVVTFQCTSEGFDTTRDLLDIRFNGESIIQYVNGEPLYFNGHSEMDYSIQYIPATNNKAGISLVINEVNVDDDGLYTCTVTPHGMNMFTSESILLVVQYFPSPGCFVGNSGDDVSLSGDQLIISRTGVSVSLICSARTTDTNVYVGWAAADGRQTPARASVMQTFTFISSRTDNGVHFTCTSTSSSIANVIYQCKIIVFISDDVKTTIAVPTRITIPETLDTVPATATPTTTPLKTSSTPLKSTSNIPSPIPSTKVITDASEYPITTSVTSKLSNSQFPGTDIFTSLTRSASTKSNGNQNTSFNIGLATGVGGTVGVMLLIVFGFYLHRFYKRKRSESAAMVYKSSGEESDVTEIPYYASNVTGSNEQTPQTTLIETPHHYITKVANQDDQGAAYYSTSLPNNNLNHGYMDITL